MSQSQTPPGLDGRLIRSLSFAHLCTDLCQGALPALFPFLITAHRATLASVSALIFVATIGSSVIQPVFGIWTDKFSRPALMPCGVALAACGIGLAGLCDSYAILVVSVGVMGIGVAAFHPEAARVAHVVSTGRRGAGMSYFAVGGNLGYAVGPLVTTPLVLLFGLKATPLLAIPGLIAAALLVRALPQVVRLLEPVTGEQAQTVSSRAAKPAVAWGPFWRLVAVVIVRSAPFFALSALVPIYLLRHFHTSAWLAGFGLTLMLLGGAGGTLLGGYCADRLGPRQVMIGAMVPLTVLLIALRFAGVAEFIILLVAVGATLEGPFSTTILLGQEYLPGRVGLASGITYGLAIGLGGILGSALGSLAGATSIEFVIGLLPIFAALAVVLTLTLPQPAEAPAVTAENGGAATFKSKPVRS